jgi:hypothetical protein
VTKPAPNWRRVVRELEWLVRREPVAERLMGVEPVPVEMAALTLPLRAGVDLAEATEVAAADLTAACPHRLQ